jgi:hypothetical protein
VGTGPIAAYNSSVVPAADDVGLVAEPAQLVIASSCVQPFQIAESRSTATGPAPDRPGAGRELLSFASGTASRMRPAVICGPLADTASRSGGSPEAGGPRARDRRAAPALHPSRSQIVFSHRSRKPPKRSGQDCIRRQVRLPRSRHKKGAYRAKLHDAGHSERNRLARNGESRGSMPPWMISAASMRPTTGPSVIPL